MIKEFTGDTILKKKIVIGLFYILLIISAVFYLKKDAIFQRGNPIPYLMAMTQISEENTYIKVFDDREIYISRRGECPELFSYFKNRINGEFVEQAGSGFLFTDGEKNYVISSEVYWGKYKVWTLPEAER